MNYRFARTMAWHRWWISWGLGVAIMATWVGLELFRWATFQPDATEPVTKMQPAMHKPAAQTLPGYVRI